MAKRRRNKSTWLPIIPTVYEEGSEVNEVTWWDSTLTFPGGERVPGDLSVGITPITYDDSATQSEAGTASLRDKVEGQDYTLDRAVGKVWMSTQYLTAESSIRQIVGCMALCVLPTDVDGLPTTPPEEYNPLSTRNSQQPWIWRRTWVLDNLNNWTGFTPPFPSSTARYGSLLEGGHLDTRGSRRRIRREHRLFMVAAAGVLQASGDAPEPNLIQWGYDLRLIGGMRRGQNSSSF